MIWTEERVAAWRRTGVRPPVAVWTPEKTGPFLDAAMRDRLYPICHLIAYRGLRPGESVGLPWEDIDFAGRQLVVTQQVVQLGWETEIGAPKTDSGTRVLPLDAGALAVLQAWRHLQQAEAQAWGSAWQHTGFVFTREDGTGYTPTSSPSPSTGSLGPPAFRRSGCTTSVTPPPAWPFGPAYP